MRSEEILEGVFECIGQALDMDPSEIQAHSRLIDDLGADSLDLLDMVFQLEQRFNVKLSVQFLERQTRRALGGAPIEIDGVYTDEAMRLIRKAMPEVPAEELLDGLAVRDLPSRFRVATMANLVKSSLEAKT